jgi:hypothetical protein
VLVNGLDLELWPPRNEALKHLEIYGEGLYLSRHASKAHHFSAGCGFVLLIAASFTDSHMVVLPDQSRVVPDGASTAIIVPGRQLPASPSDGSLGDARARGGLGAMVHGAAEEFVVFKERLPPLMPVCLIEYSEDTSGPTSEVGGAERAFLIN